MSFIRKIKKKSGTYMAKVETYREDGKVKQRVLKYLGKEINGKPAKRTNSADISLVHVKQSLDISAIDKLVNELNLKELLENKYVLSLVYSQLLENRSISKLENWLKFTEIPARLELKEITTNNLYTSLRDLSNQDFDEIEESLYNSFKKFESEETAVIIDITDTYFEGKYSNEKSRKGKDGKIKKLIQFGLAVSLENGFPIFCNQYSGNLSDTQIFKDMNLKLKEKGLKSIVVDRGMTSKENLRMVLDLDLTTISGLRKNSKIVREYIEPINKDKLYSIENRVKLKKTAVYIKTVDYFNGKLIIVYNPQLDFLKKEHAFEKGITKEKYYGFSLIYHNTNFADSEVVKKYYEKDTVERAFKQLKGILNLRPIRVWLKEHVEGHFKICYLAYAILSYMNFKLKKEKISGIDALDSLKQGYKIRLKDKINKFEWDLMVPLEPKQKKIMKAIERSV